ncbi:MAG: UDP-N-acetylmuramoyl-L-alanine--D-glutamate ligase [Eggerthellaceae bacterium]|jgi:UDP-N-acetylmuramoylalanine--D-glutamate ligase|nr:UDP-N-acetylmuramoyl-L-alanine--D-glutamate ligase [Eggerthellaceae bacterium]MCH4220882.1 UDP-N-acetylmuramoyl-L-alanine--D-glutamate ligase [Eggerthellaceae bacterium]
MSEKKSAVELLSCGKYAPAHLGDILVLGLGKSGRAAACYCLDRLGSRVTSVSIAAGVIDDDGRAFAQSCAERGAKVTSDSYDINGSYDLCIASPGISQFSDFYQNAASASDEIISEVEFAWRESDPDSTWVAITGTNGKTTTTALTTHILTQAGLPFVAVGNIGDTCLDAVARHTAKGYVAEVSSFQLASTEYFAPDIAIMLNITPDHVEWHKSNEAYIDAKMNILKNLATSHGVAIMNASDEVVRHRIDDEYSLKGSQHSFECIPVGSAAGIDTPYCAIDHSASLAFLQDRSMLTIVYRGEEHTLCSRNDLQIPGLHNVLNALMAASAAVVLGVPDDKIISALTSFQSLEHRLEFCGTVKGARCFNDSKATNVDATLKAFAAFDDCRPIVMLGGHDKGTPLDELVVQAELHCKSVICFGAAAARFAQAFSDASIPVYVEKTMEPALDRAIALSSDGDIILLSPACSSYDEFSCFEERGTMFKQMVHDRADR